MKFSKKKETWQGELCKNDWLTRIQESKSKKKREQHKIYLDNIRESPNCEIKIAKK